MNTNSSIKKRLNIVPYTQKPNESIYRKINLEFLNSFKLSSSLIDFGLGSLTKSFQEQQQYSAQQLTSLVSDVLGSMVKSTYNSDLAISISEIISDIAQECLNIISTINSELSIPENNLHDLYDNIHSAHQYIENTYNVNTLNQNITINVQVNSPSNKVASDKHNLDTYKILTLLIGLLSLIQQICSDSESSKFKSQPINNEIQVIQKLDNINSSMKDISKYLKLP